MGHGDFKYRLNKEWGKLEYSNWPVKNCHEMVMDSLGRLILITDHTRNNIIIYDKSGRVLNSWGTNFPGGHGLTLFKEEEQDVLFITDVSLGKVFKTTIDGEIIMTIEHPKTIGVYKDDAPFKPTETAIAPNGDIYVADGYGSQYVIQYDHSGNYIRHFGGKGNQDDQFDTVHGICIDNRNSDNPTLLCTSREHNAFKRFSLDGDYLSTIFLPGAYVCRPVVDGVNIYSGVCWSRLRYLNKTENSGFITILDENDKVISNPGGTEPTYENGELKLMVQDEPIFKHCHDVCVDEYKNLYVCQWNAEYEYPYMLERI